MPTCWISSSPSPRVCRAASALLLTLLSTLGMIAASESRACADTPPQSPNVGVGSQYDSSHVYVAPADVGRFAASFVATFGGTSTPESLTTITPTASKTVWQAVSTPVGLVSILGFTTPIPYPFGAERTGYLVTDVNAATEVARSTAPMSSWRRSAIRSAAT